MHLIVSTLLALAGLLLMAGLWTPVVGALVAIVAMSELFTTAEPPVGRLLIATRAVALAMLGPGRLSIDARLFGWKRIDAPTAPQIIRTAAAGTHARKGPPRRTLPSRLRPHRGVV